MKATAHLDEAAAALLTRVSRLTEQLRETVKALIGALEAKARKKVEVSEIRFEGVLEAVNATLRHILEVMDALPTTFKKEEKRPLNIPTVKKLEMQISSREIKVAGEGQPLFTQDTRVVMSLCKKYICILNKGCSEIYHYS